MLEVHSQLHRNTTLLHKKIKQTPTEKYMKFSIHTPTNTYMIRKEFLFKKTLLTSGSREKALNELINMTRQHKKSNTYKYIFIPLEKQSNHRIRTLSEQTHMNRLNNVHETVFMRISIN